MNAALNQQWWRDAVVYQIYPRSFADSNDDGEGDLAGITSRIDYLRKLGIDAVWLNPCYLSPMRDGGYDVADYRRIDPRFGSEADFDAFVNACHSAGIRVIMDIVPNHCSSEHVWFREALSSPAGSEPWRRFHCVRGRGDGGHEPPNQWQSVFSGPAWTELSNADGTASGWWYLHLFDPSQPDLNWDCDDVRAEFDDIIRHWFDRGVDGLRIDVATGMVKAPGYPEPDDSWPHPHWDQDGVHDIFRRWRSIADEYDDRVLVAEAILGFPDRLARYLRPDELHMAFNFSSLTSPWDATSFVDAITWPLFHNDSIGAPTTWLLENHDIARVVSRFSGAPLRQPEENITILDHVPARALTDAELERGTARSRAALLMSLALPGSFYLYAGGELGLPEVLEIADDYRDDPVWHRTAGGTTGRDGCRVPLPWTEDGATFGFNVGEKTWLPQPAWWGRWSVERQELDAHSCLAFTRAAIAARHAVRFVGSTTDVTAHDGVLTFTRDTADAVRVRCTVNMGENAVPLPAGEVIIASTPVADALPPDVCVWTYT
ncbi:MAG: hypothetical protein EBU85_06350 [Actinobacteria bacterium]|nr:hypothetical protein [Actinomycetota bacterium]